jgi:hypothetical protein
MLSVTEVSPNLNRPIGTAIWSSLRGRCCNLKFGVLVLRTIE